MKQRDTEKKHSFVSLPPRAERIISYNTHFSRLRRLPGHVAAEVVTQIREVADSDSYDEASRCLAAYAMATFLIGSHRSAASSSPSLSEAGKYLLLSARIGHQQSRTTLGMILDWMGMPNPIEQEVEENWLYIQAVVGSRLASSRLKHLNPERYAEALQDGKAMVVSDIRRGVSISETSDQAYSESDYLKDNNELREVLPLICRYLLAEGWYLSFERILELPNIDADMSSGMGTSLLMNACRKGDCRIARLLIEHGASMRDEDSGMTPLHYLARFRDEDMIPLAELLKERGADLEARCDLQTRYTFGQTDLADTILNATPLLCAVRHGNLAAVSALIAVGADAFSGSKKYEKYAGTLPAEQKGRTYSPVHYAARLHVSEILEALLPEDKEYEQLLDWMCYETHTLNVTPLWCAVDYWYQGMYDRVLLHGKDHIKKCEDTITFLLKRGAQGHAVCWDVQTQARHSVFTAASLYGQPFVLNHLRFLKLEPTTRNLVRTLQIALDVEDSRAIDYLLPIAEREARDSECTLKLKASIQGHKTADFVDYLYCIKERLEANTASKLKLDLIRDEKLRETIGPDDREDILEQKTSQGGFKITFAIRPGPGGYTVMEPKGEPSNLPPEGSPLPIATDDNPLSAFELAVIGGYESRARKLYETQQCDVHCRRVDKRGDETTLLARLIVKSRKYSNTDNRVLFLLGLTPPSAEEFFNAWKPAGSPSNESLSILHISVILAEWETEFTPRAPRQIISAIIDKYPEPEYLNVLSGDGGAAVHMAVETGNRDALKELEQEDVDWNLLNGDGETPMDVSARRQYKVHEFLQQTHKLDKLGKPTEYKAAVNEYRANVARMQKLLVGKGGRHKKYGGFMYRMSEKMWRLTELKGFVCQEINVAEHLELLERGGVESGSVDEAAAKAHIEKLRAWSRLGVDESMVCPFLTDGTLDGGGGLMGESGCCAGEDALKHKKASN
ncbi:hypothetical protein BKA65DRAFT_416369 [Rhexocercosporidium sp. MPI-PUGE-AT-0058]|nr:hypothetical protein BKA65DRAFT_416369 [Rhexocercosporidium sp. MPI-PUGE-AT-0058]